VEELRLGRVDVLRPERIVLVQPARLEAEHASARVGQRKEEPALEIVVATLPRQTGRAQLLEREPLLERLPGQRVAAEREAEPELAAALLAQAAAGEVVARRRARLRVPEDPAVVDGRILEQLVQSLAPPAVGLLPLRRLF